MKNKLIRKLLNFLRIKEYNGYGFDITRELTYEANAAKNKIWYNGDGGELSQLYGQTTNRNNSFWGATETRGMEIRKIHSGLPHLIVSTLANIVLADMGDLDFGEDAKSGELWEEIAEENNWKQLSKRALSDVLKVGDGAFKISFQETVSDLPLIDFYDGAYVDYVYAGGRIKEIHFFNHYDRGHKRYTLEEIYGYGYINYRLYNDNEEVPLTTLTETADLEPLTFDKRVILAVPFSIFASDVYKGRGASIYDGKTDAFDALDEVLSQWIDALRSARTRTYIPESLIPRNFETGGLLTPNNFDNRFIKIASDLSEGAKNTIDVESPIIQTDAYVETYMTVLDLCLQGIISPSTLGIDVKKLDNAEAQREKEKMTLYTRQTIIDAMVPVLRDLVQAVFNAYALQYRQTITDVAFDVNFGEYANPSFEAVIETMSNPNTPMSIEARVEEIWGNSKTREWKDEEIRRIKEQRGLTELDLPALNSKISIYDNETAAKIGIFKNENLTP